MAKLKFTPNPTFELLVSVPIAGQSENEEITFTVKYITKKESEKLHTKYKAEENDYLYYWNMTKSLVVGWDLNIEFNEQNLDILLDSYPQIPQKFNLEYFREYWGLAEKN